VNTTLNSWLSSGARVRPSGTAHKLFVRQEGPHDGKPVTLFHGFPASSFDWAGVVPELAGRGYRVTTLDFLGFGSSDKPHPYSYNLVEQASLVEALWADLGIDQTALIAHDYGDSVAQELLCRNPCRIDSMAWLNGGIFADLHHATETQRHLSELDSTDAEERLTENLYRRELSSLLGRKVDTQIMDAMWADFSRLRGTRVVPALLGYMAERRENATRWTHAVESYSGPQTFIWGPADPVSGAHVLPRIREKVRSARIAVLDTPPPVGHFPQVEAPELVAPLLVEHLKAAG
jgi:pimeloyl-ACP methyl ester carboxylesterase